MSLLLCAVAAAAAPVCAQGGGKAEPLRIEFKRGAQSATVKGRVRRDEQAEYVFAARQGQQITIRLISNPAKSAFLNLIGPGGRYFFSKNLNGHTWSEVAPTTGDYAVYVNKQDKKIDKASFSLILTVK